jgi:hypothetical protein
LHRWLKGKLVVVLAAVAVIAFAGVAYAASQSSGPATPQAFLNDVAKRLHVTPGQLSSALDGARVDQLQAAVRAGQLTQAQANAIEQRMKRAGNVPAVPFGFWGPGGPGVPGLPRVPGVPGAPGGFGPHLRGLPGGFAGPGGLNAAASYLGLSTPQLFQQLSAGKSLAQIATAKGKTVGGLEQAISTAAKSRLDKLVAAKVITAAQEKALLSRLSARLSQEVNRKGLPPVRFRGPGPGAWGGAGSAPGPGWGGLPAQPTLPTPPGKAPKPPAALAPGAPYAPPAPIA